MSEDDDNRSELEAEARVLPERELMSLIADSAPPADGRDEEIPESDSEDASP